MHCDAFLFPSHSLASTYLAWGLPPERCSVIPNGLASLPGQVKRAPPSASVNRFAFFGQMIETKGLHVVLEALRSLAGAGRVAGLEFQIHGANAHFARAGYIEDLAKSAAEIAALSKGAITILDKGSYNHADIGARMAGTDYVIAPSVWPEVFGLVVSEAWMFGRPVIASAIGALAERVRPGVDGLLFPPGDSQALAEIIATLAGDAAAWRRMSSAIRPPDSGARMTASYLALWKRMARHAA